MYKSKQNYIVTTGERWIYVGRERSKSGWLKLVCYLADTSLRTSPVICHTRHRDEAVRLTKGEAAAEALQCKGKVLKEG